MSTRCQIGIYRTKPTDLTNYAALLYRHSDGYPEGVLPDVVPFLNTFHKQRGMDDTEYLAAWLMHHLIQLSVDAKYSKFVGYGISNCLHEDIEYFYAIYPGHIDVYECGWEESPKKWKLVQEIDITREVVTA